MAAGLTEDAHTIENTPKLGYSQGYSTFPPERDPGKITLSRHASMEYCYPRQNSLEIRHQQKVCWLCTEKV